MDVLNKFTSIVRKGVDDYSMIDEGDTIAVGVSGGKDSLVLLRSLAHLRNYYPKKFELMALTIDMGFPNMDFSPVAKLCENISVPYTCLKSDIREIVFDVRKEKNPCSLCSKMRRGAINDAIKARGISKLALGHHMDDVVETFLMSLIFEGRVSCFRPVTYLDRSDVCQIRPMVYAGEQRIAEVCERLGLPVVETSCPEDKESKRREIKGLITALQNDYPDIRAKVFGAIQRLPLNGWGINNRQEND